MLETYTDVFSKLSHSHFSVKDDPILLRTHVVTKREACEKLRDKIKDMRPSRYVTFSTFCHCLCHKLKKHGGWESETCCPDCGASLVDIGPVG